ncbi:MAG TPA: hypothetical protein VFN35_36645 [Ktedonobacteraceae bacterium]|nr:hypothetical protein [Ktedonobacteraceae bacterium]
MRWLSRQMVAPLFPVRAIGLSACGEHISGLDEVIPARARFVDAHRASVKTGGQRA